MNLPEPALIKKINAKIATALAFIAPSNSNGYLTAGILGIKLIQVMHFKEGITRENLRDAWLNKSASTVKPYIINNWFNIVRVLYNRDISYDGRRLFLTACYGNVSLSQKLGKYIGTTCPVPGCNRVFSTQSAYFNTDAADRCTYCQLPLIRGIAGTNKNNNNPENILFKESVGKFKQTH